MSSAFSFHSIAIDALVETVRQIGCALSLSKGVEARFDRLSAHS
jgi:hypothetical protein